MNNKYYSFVYFTKVSHNNGLIISLTQVSRTKLIYKCRVFMAIRIIKMQLRNGKIVTTRFENDEVQSVPAKHLCCGENDKPTTKIFHHNDNDDDVNSITLHYFVQTVLKIIKFSHVDSHEKLSSIDDRISCIVKHMDLTRWNDSKHISSIVSKLLAHFTCCSNLWIRLLNFCLKVVDLARKKDAKVAASIILLDTTYNILKNFADSNSPLDPKKLSLLGQCIFLKIVEFTMDEGPVFEGQTAWNRFSPLVKLIITLLQHEEKSFVTRIIRVILSKHELECAPKDKPFSSINHISNILIDDDAKNIAELYKLFDE